MQSIALYREKLWWKSQKNYAKDLQKLINQQVQFITRMYWSSPIPPLINNLELLLAHILLNFQQQAYAHHILSLPDSIPIKDILLITLQTEDRNT